MRTMEPIEPGVEDQMKRLDQIITTDFIPDYISHYQMASSVPQSKEDSLLCRRN